MVVTDQIGTYVVQLLGVQTAKNFFLKKMTNDKDSTRMIFDNCIIKFVDVDTDAKIDLIVYCTYEPKRSSHKRIISDAVDFLRQGKKKAPVFFYNLNQSKSLGSYVLAEIMSYIDNELNYELKYLFVHDSIQSHSNYNSAWENFWYKFDSMIARSSNEISEEVSKYIKNKKTIVSDIFSELNYQHDFNKKRESMRFAFVVIFVMYAIPLLCMYLHISYSIIQNVGITSESVADILSSMFSFLLIIVVVLLIQVVLSMCVVDFRKFKNIKYNKGTIVEAVIVIDIFEIKLSKLKYVTDDGIVYDH